MFRRAALGLCLGLIGCQSTLQNVGQDAGPVASSCATCVTGSDCSKPEVCSQLENDNFCLRPCLFASDCAPTDQCVLLTTYNGQSASACAAMTGPCGQLAPGTITVIDGGNNSEPDAGGTQSGWCGVYAGPTVSGTQCHCGESGSCAANNCYGGWYCDTTTNKCVAPPTGCSTTTVPDAGMSTVPDAGSGPVPDGGPITGTITASGGGSASNLFFVVVGDTRPANDNDTSGYPTSIITGIYKDIAGMNPAPLFVLGTGDYQFADPGSGDNAPQIALYMSARNQWKGIFWPAMGNHECTGATASNCDTDATSNFTTFQSNMLTPIGETLPYYSRKITASDNSWTANFIFAASNYWDSTQETWYKQQLATSSTYTFIVDHEYQGSGSPGDEAIYSDAQSYPHTIHIVGHTHTWEQHSDTVVIGNGGAPITGGAPYGFTTFERRASDGAIVITGYDYTSNAPAGGEQFCVSPTGGSVSTCP